MQRDAKPVLVLLTDGVFNALKINDSLRLLKEHDVSFGIISVIAKKQKPISFGHLFNQGTGYSFSHKDYLEFLVKSLDGTLFKWSFFNDIDEIKIKEKRKTSITFQKSEKLESDFENNIRMNRKKLIHYALLFKSSPINVVDRESLNQTLVYTPQKITSNYVSEKILEYKIKGGEFDNFLKMRILEGFFIEDIGYNPTDTTLNHIQMRSYFLPNIILKYNMTLLNGKDSINKEDKLNPFITVEITLNAPKVFMDGFLEFKKV
jgi:hypothetical protein